MAHVAVTRCVPGRAIEMLTAAGHEVTTWPDEAAPSAARLRELLAGADAALTMLTDRIDGPLLEAAPGLRIVANMAAGYDNVDPEQAAAAGVWVTNTPGVLAEATADFAFALLLAAARRVVESDRDVRAGNWKTWSPTGFLGQDVHGATLGIVGLGEIGQAVARRAAGFRMRLLYASRTRHEELEDALGIRWCALDDLVAASDFISLHVPLTAATRFMIDARQVERMKPSAVLVNTSRGQVVDQAALVDALRERRIGAAALDVTDPEPLPAGHPLFDLPSAIITPHIASASLATRSRMAEMAAANILAVLAGEAPPNAVNRPITRR